MEMMKTCCSEVNLNLESLSNCNFLNEIFFIYNFSKKKWYKNKEKQKKLFQLCFILKIIRIIYFCVKTEKEQFYCISWKFYTKKIEK